FWEAHHSHYYQRVVLLGWSPRKTVLAEYALMLGVGVSALVLHYAGDGPIVLAGLAGWGLVYFILVMVIRHFESGKTGA
ncbi:MAG: UDP-phosphate N-acetylglucosaminyl 1-phosphate transferase, partial [SAR324 cluster bacterium]|nr:UDP-phosphate N-acetylglucosaminyl 1-phosphate transferase [SAR324 cluster bacterium]